MAKYRKKPIVIDAFQWNGDKSTQELFKFLGKTNGSVFAPNNDEESLVIFTLEGDMKASIGDWVIRGIKGELYPCKNDIFIATYELVEEAKEKENG